MENDWFGMAGVAEYLGVSVETIKGWLKGRGDNGFKKYTTKIGQKRIITYENASRFIRGWKPEVDPQEMLREKSGHKNEELRSDIEGVSA